MCITIANCVPGAQRDFHFVRHWREVVVGWSDEVVRRRCAGGGIAAVGRLLADGSGGRDSEVAADARDRVGAL